MNTQQQLRDYFAYVDDQQGGVDTAGLVENDGTAVQVIQPARRRRTPTLAWVAVVAVVVAVLMLPILFFNGSESDVVTTSASTVPATTIPPTTVPPTTAPTPIEGSSEATVEWELVTFDGVSGPLHGDVIAGDGRFLAIQAALEERAPMSEGGGPIDADGDPRTILWTSVDGAVWKYHEIDVSEGNLPFVVGDIDGRVIIRQWQGDDGAFGTGSDGDEHVAYWSDDLATWTPIDFPVMEYEVDGVSREWSPWDLYEVVATDEAALLPGRGFIVRADLGLSAFELIDAPFGMDPTTGEPLGLTDLVATSDRFYASVGVGDSGLSGVWSSVDGIDWAEETVDGAPISEGDIAAGDDMVMALDGAGRWYRSEAGGPFEHVEGVSLEAGSEGHIRIVGSSDGFLLLGAFGFGDDAGIRSLGPWLSLDGRSWTWTPIEGTTADSFGAASIGESILIPTGSWVVEFDGDGNIWSEDWVSDGGWALGRVIPAG